MPPPTMTQPPTVRGPDSWPWYASIACLLLLMPYSLPQVWHEASCSLAGTLTWVAARLA
jgi:hypothetical protein